MASYDGAREGEIMLDIRMGFDEALAGTLAPPEVINTLSLLDVLYYSFDGKLHQGQLVIRDQLRDEIGQIFARIRALRFPVEKIVPVVRYGWSDLASMADNNTSAFNYRVIAGTNRLSSHAYGMAVDINPRQNPVIYEDGSVLPAGAAYDPQASGSFHPDCAVLREFLSLGWKWGGDFSSFKDYHHFEKPFL
jgi:peptidoglycan LD-endopeptidase CwlK